MEHLVLFCFKSLKRPIVPHEYWKHAVCLSLDQAHDIPVKYMLNVIWHANKTTILKVFKNSLIMFGVILGIQDSYLKQFHAMLKGKYERVLVCSTTSLSIYISFTKHVRFDPIWTNYFSCSLACPPSQCEKPLVHHLNHQFVLYLILWYLFLFKDQNNLAARPWKMIIGTLLSS